MKHEALPALESMTDIYFFGNIFQNLIPEKSSWFFIRLDNAKFLLKHSFYMAYSYLEFHERYHIILYYLELASL